MDPRKIPLWTPRVKSAPKVARGREGWARGAAILPPVPRITLVRHGRPLCDEDSWIPARAFDAWWQAYDEAGLVDDSHPPQELAPALADCDRFVTSNLRRAKHSLERVRPDAKPLEDARFREAPIPGVPLPILRMPSAGWRVLGRLAWLGGYAGSVESARGTYRRVAEAADQLGEWSGESEHIGVVAHGFFNYLLCGALRKRGWEGSRVGTPGHWSHTTLRRP